MGYAMRFLRLIRIDHSGRVTSPALHLVPAFISILIAFSGNAQEPAGNAPAGDRALAVTPEPALRPASGAGPGGMVSGGPGGRPPGSGVSLRAGYRWDIPVDFTDKGDISAQHAGGGLTTMFPVSRTIFGSLDLDVDYVSYSFSVEDDSPFAYSGLMRHAADVRISPMLAGKVNDRWGWMARVTGAFTGETDADAGKSFSPGGMAGLVYNCNPRLKLTFGLVASALLADVPLAFPIVGFDWAATDRLRLATRGPGLDIIMKLTPQTTLAVKGRWDYRRYRLADKDPEPNGIFRDQRINAGVELSRRFLRSMEVALEAGASLYQQYRLEDSDENTVERIDTDPQGYCGARLALQY